MARLDKIHYAVKNALIKDNWTITDDPLSFLFETQRVLIDIAAEKVFTAEKEGRKIAVEVKSFLSVAKMNEFYGAIGQYDVYSVYLEELEPERKLFLAVSQEIYKDFFERKAVQLVTRKKNIAILVVNVETEEIVEWISQPNT
jgi:XisH protein